MLDSEQTLTSAQLFWKYIADNHLGEAANFVGLFLAILSAFSSIWAAIKSSGAKRVALETKKKFDETYAIENIFSALELVKEVKNAQRLKTWEALPDKYAGLRTRLIRIRSISSGLSSQEETQLQQGIAQTKELEKIVDSHLLSNRAEPKIMKLIDIIRDLEEDLEKLLANKRGKAGEA